MPQRPLSGWTNLQDIFAANKGNGAQMNDRVYGGLEQAGQAALDRLGQAKSGFRLAADRAGLRPGYDQPAGRQAPTPAPITLPAASGALGTVPGSTTGSITTAIGGKPQPTSYSGNQQDEATKSARSNDDAQKAAKAAQQAYSDAQKATQAATTRANDTYQGPRTLKEYDPGVGTAIGDAAARINASPQAQFGAVYQGTSAGGGALDQALMGTEGGLERSQALTGKFGGLVQQLRDEQAAAAKYGGGLADARDADAASWREKLPGLQSAEGLALRGRDDANTVAKNNAERDAYEQAWLRDTQAMKHGRRGSQIQRAYRPPQSTELPVYPAS